MPSPPKPELLVDRPTRFDGVVIVLAHGAGGSSSDPLLVDLTKRLVTRGHAVVRFDFAYRAQGRKLPDRAPVLESTYRDAIAAARKRFARSKPRAWIIGGKSMGGRMASHLAAQGDDVDGLLLLGYPLHPPLKKPGDTPTKLRVDHLSDIRVPTLFLQGTRDPLCDLKRLREALAPLGDHLVLDLIDEADHSLARPRRAGGARSEQMDDVSARIERWLDRVASRAVTTSRFART
jgi:predicted alpha/beta-hydrolase family hydrolase